jgi:hypothetical protein
MLVGFTIALLAAELAISHRLIVGGGSTSANIG